MSSYNTNFILCNEYSFTDKFPCRLYQRESLGETIMTLKSLSRHIQVGSIPPPGAHYITRLLEAEPKETGVESNIQASCDFLWGQMPLSFPKFQVD